MRRLCPVCTNRRNQLIDPECLVCQGSGFLILGEGALSLYSADVVAEAVVLALEAKAREADLSLTLSDDRSPAVEEALEMLSTAGLLAEAERVPYLVPPRPPRDRPRKRDGAGRYAVEHDPTDVAARAIQAELFPLDRVLSGAECFVYQEHERPNARGLPVLSANGHPSHLARIADPMEPGSDTGAEARARRNDARRAVVLLTAAGQAARTKSRRQQRERIAS